MIPELIIGVITMATPYGLFSAPVKEQPANPFSSMGAPAPQQATAVEPQPVPLPQPTLDLGGNAAPSPINLGIPQQLSGETLVEEPQLDLDSLLGPVLKPMDIEKPVKYDLNLVKEFMTDEEMRQHGIVSQQDTDGKYSTELIDKEKLVNSLPKAKQPIHMVLERVKNFKDYDKYKDDLRLDSDTVLAPFSNKDKPFYAMIAGRESNMGKYRVHNMIDNPKSMHNGSRAISSFGVMPASAKDAVTRFKHSDEAKKRFPELEEIEKIPDTKEGLFEISKITANNPSLDAYLAKAIFESKKQYGRQIGLKTPDEQNLFALVSYFTGENNAAKIVKEHGVEALQNHVYIEDMRKDLERFKWQEKYPGFDVPGITRKIKTDVKPSAESKPLPNQ